MSTTRGQRGGPGPWVIVLVIGKTLLVVAALFVVLRLVGLAQSCRPPLYQGYVASAQALNVRLLVQTPIESINFLQAIWADGVIQTAPANATGFTRQTGCGFASHLTIRQVNKDGSVCDTRTTGSAPHTAPCTTANNNRFSVLNAASYKGDLAADSIAVGFADPGQTFTSATAYATTQPLPTRLGDLLVFIDDTLTGLFYVSPTQINFAVPAGLSSGSHTVRVLTPAGPQLFGELFISTNAPGVFTKSMNGQGEAASQTIRAGATTYLILYVTGVPSPRAGCALLFNRQTYPASYCGPAPGYVGLQQANVPVPTDQLPAFIQGVSLRVFQVGGGYWDSPFTDVRTQ